MCLGYPARQAGIGAGGQCRVARIGVEDGTRAQEAATIRLADLNHAIEPAAAVFPGGIDQAALADVVKVDYWDPGAREKKPLARLDDLEPYPERRLADVLLPDTGSARPRRANGA